MKNPQATSHDPAGSLSQRVIRAVLAVFVMLLSSNSWLSAAVSCDAGTAVMAKSCACCVGKVCECEAMPPADQQKPVLPASASSHESIVFVAHEADRDSITLAAIERGDKAQPWATDATASSRQVPLYCQHCSRLI